MKKPASEVQVGDKVLFPGKRRGKELEATSVERDDDAGTVTINAEGIQWMMKADTEVEVAEV